MPNILFELDRLRAILENKGLDPRSVEIIINQARADIDAAFTEQAQAGMQIAIEQGVQKRSADFINDLQMDRVNLELTTMSGNMDFSEPPFPMLPHLLKNAKPIKDGSGVYNVIPVGEPSKDRPKVSANIFDAWKQINAERVEAAQAQYKRVAPKSSKANFRTATSKQNSATQWVLPATDKDFTEDMRGINKELNESMDDIIKAIIREYEEGF